jgi:hypothetical protein
MSFFRTDSRFLRPAARKSGNLFQREARKCRKKLEVTKRVPPVYEEATMRFDLLRDRVRQAIRRLDRLPDRESDDLAEAVEECLRMAEENWDRGMGED